MCDRIHSPSSTIGLHISSLQCLIYRQALYLGHSLETHLLRYSVDNYWADQFLICKFVKLRDHATACRLVYVCTDLAFYDLVLRLCGGGGIMPPLW